MAFFPKTLWWLILGSLLLIAACANGGSTGPVAPYGYNSPYYSTDYPEQDPEYWRRWEDVQGGGG